MDFYSYVEGTFTSANDRPWSVPVSHYSPQVFHAGTALNAGGELVSAGGRVLNVTALGKDVGEAQANAYKVSALRCFVLGVQALMFVTSARFIHHYLCSSAISAIPLLAP